MAQGRELKGRIKSIEGTRKITRSMEMVATSKLKRAQDRVVAARPYARALEAVIADLYSPELAERFPLLRQPESGAQKDIPKSGSRAAVILLTSNQGLAGAFNANLIREARDAARPPRRRRASRPRSTSSGARASASSATSGRRSHPRASTSATSRSRSTARSWSIALMKDFIEKRLDAVYVVYAKYNSPLSTPPVAERVLPVTPPARKGTARDYLLFPNAEEILSALLPLYVRNAIYRALVETVAGEQGARSTAMKAATDNAGDILNVLRRTYNRARQAQITQEIAEIVGGAEALSG